MNTVIKALAVFVLVVLAQVSLAADASKETVTNANKNASSATSHNFEDLLIQGKYHFSDEAVTTVEADKVFDSLIGVRSDFKDRLEESASKQ